MSISDWFNYEGVPIRRVDGGPAYTYRTGHVALDADGSPRAYHPDDIGIDANANAGYPLKGWRSVLAVDPADSSRPFVQPDGPHRGYFVSKTSLRDHDLPDTDPRAFVDAEAIPYIVFPGAFYGVQGTGRYGDLAIVRDVERDRQTAAIVADGGPSKAPLGEMSLALATALGGTHPNPRNGQGAPRGTFQYVIFPGSSARPAWPRQWTEIEASAERLLAQIGGWP